MRAEQLSLRTGRTPPDGFGVLTRHARRSPPSQRTRTCRVPRLAPGPYPACRTSAGVRFSSALRGRLFSSLCVSSTSSGGTCFNSFHLGQYCRAGPFVCSLSPAPTCGTVARGLGSTCPDPAPRPLPHDLGTPCRSIPVFVGEQFVLQAPSGFGLVPVGSWPTAVISRWDPTLTVVQPMIREFLARRAVDGIFCWLYRYPIV